ncbi:protein POOR HOMOLOGOUS SYNAPSIS 1 isoform X2 [Solanum dulcamara]|uniref:protein POOR HOMOLOGOUS SYNAPSIS 1 isoform X2 n=1 Tax=Solanum dulcamara TaxID=45834 RepID=UPI0024861E04|nr:protein POOR HOMOLOGOUS SYNAPSIS 1 isoform X2 [Solanum dulcamara]
MAGSHSRPPIAAAEQSALPSSMSIATVTNHWEVQYARFILCPASPYSFHSSLISLSSIGRKYGKSGRWISSASLVSLKLRTNSFDPNSGFILVVSLRDRILEEHYISRLMFSWPQVSCVSGFPARGSRAVLVSYRGSVGQIQKFILRFLTIYEIENFMNILKGKLANANPQAFPCVEFDSAISSQSEFIPLDGALHRDNKGWICEASGVSTPHYIPLTLAPEYSQDSHTEEMKLSREAEEILSAFPPSFTSFLTNCCPEIDQVAAQSSITKEVDLIDQIAKYLEDSSFQDMLVKIEKVIHELGDNTVL